MTERVLSVDPPWVVARQLGESAAVESSNTAVPEPTCGIAMMPSTLRASAHYAVESADTRTPHPQRMCVRIHVGKSEVFAGEGMFVSPDLVYTNASCLSRLCGGQLPEASSVSAILVDMFSSTKQTFACRAIHVPRNWSPSLPFVNDHALVRTTSQATRVAAADECNAQIPQDVLRVVRGVGVASHEHLVEQNQAQRPPQSVAGDVKANAGPPQGGKRGRASAKRRNKCWRGRKIHCKDPCGCPRGAARFEGKPWKLPCDYDPVRAARVVAQSGAWSSGNAVGCLPNGLNVRLLPRTSLAKPDAAQWNSSGQYYYEVQRRFAGLPVPTVLGMRQRRTPVLTLPDFCAKDTTDPHHPRYDDDVILERVVAKGGLRNGAIMG